MDRIKRLSYEVLDAHKSKFGEDFADNKKILDQISIIRSKGLKNEVAGYITKFIKKEIREEKVKQAQILSSEAEEKIIEVESETPEIIESSEETPSKTVVESSVTEETAETPENKTEDFPCLAEESAPFTAIKIFSGSNFRVFSGFVANKKSILP